MAAKKISVSHLIHCAGKAPILSNSRTKINQLYEIFNINLFSAIILCKLLAKSSINCDTLKTIVFISSNLSSMGASGMTLYGASKSGLDGYMRSLAMELAPNIRVNSVLPGPISTEMTKDFITSINTNELKKYPLGFGQTDDIAQIVKFLISNESKWISGQQFIIDGGRSINLSM
jgi:NAD(P)-dependent dehydrogenase (short-subunit alcohol dehydrogenase family)